MFCPKCGANQAEDAQQCAQCGTELRKAEVPNYLVPAILTTLCCCLPFGIVAIVYAAQVNGKLSGGDIEGAQESSRKAKMWCWVAFGVGLGFTALWIVLQVVLGVAGGATAGM